MLGSFDIRNIYTRIYTDIVDNRLNRPRGRFSKIHIGHIETFIKKGKLMVNNDLKVHTFCELLHIVISFLLCEICLGLGQFCMFPL